MDINTLVGKTLLRVQQIGDDIIIFETDSGEIYKLHHVQDCCESVYIESVVGEFKDLVGVPILKAEETVSECEIGQQFAWELGTWTFYKLATIKGYVDIRWLGESNGYYSERVDFEKIPED